MITAYDHHDDEQLESGVTGGRQRHCGRPGRTGGRAEMEVERNRKPDSQVR
jgi:hypothetical protein